jgi:hypothetical protein
MRLGGVLPRRPQQAARFETLERWIDGAAGEPRGVDDVEAEALAVRDRVQDGSGSVAKGRRSGQLGLYWKPT